MPPRIALYGPAQVYGIKARTLDQFRVHQRNILRANNMGEPWTYIGPPVTMYISGGKCVVDCPNCADGAVVDVEAHVALCCGCGAVFEDVQVPRQQEMRDLEDVMRLRPVMARHNRHQDRRKLGRLATIKELDDENQAMGLPSLVQARRGVLREVK